MSSESINMSALVIGFLAAFLTGLVACVWMIRIVKNSKLIYFSIYCFLVGIASILIYSFM
jgi:undecaprenyl-diphosphatase